MEQKLRRDRKIGDNLRILRDNYGISQEKLCEELQRRGCDIARSAYAKYENGVLILSMPKKEKELPEKRTLTIE